MRDCESQKLESCTPISVSVTQWRIKESDDVYAHFKDTK